MSGVDDASHLPERMDQVRGRPEELATLLEIASRRGQGRQPSAEEREAVHQLRERLGQLLSQAQRDIEELLVRTDRRLEPVERLAEPVAALPARPSSAGAYLSMAAPLREEIMEAAPLAGRPTALPSAVMDGRQADVGALAAQILEIQKGLGAL
jgi:hypothetical protein